MPPVPLWASMTCYRVTFTSTARNCCGLLCANRRVFAWKFRKHKKRLVRTVAWPLGRDSNQTPLEWKTESLSLAPDCSLINLKAYKKCVNNTDVKTETENDVFHYVEQTIFQDVAVNMQATRFYGKHVNVTSYTATRDARPFCFWFYKTRKWSHLMPNLTQTGQ